MLLNSAGYYDALLRFLDGAVGQGFLAAQNREQLQAFSDPETLLDHLQRTV